MQAVELTGGFADPAPESARAFRKIMTVMAKPGTIETVQGAEPPAPLSKAAGTLLLTLCDPETCIYLAGDFDVEPVRNWINFHIGSPMVSAADCDFAVGTWEDLAPLSRFKIGTSEYPDRSASLIVESEILENQGAVLQGPGIKDRAALSLPEVAAFKGNHTLFPLGLDFFFTCGDRNSGWQYEPLSSSIDLGLDKHNAHVQPNGTYHYHGIPTGLAEDITPDRHSKLIAYAADGFPVYLRYGYSDPKNPASGVADLTPSWRLKPGSRPGGPGGRYDGSFLEDYEHVAGLGTLDECNGRQTVTPDYPNGTYAYYLTRDWPVIPRCLRGERDRSFLKQGPGGRQPDGRGGASASMQGGRPGGGGGRPGSPPDFNKAGEILGIDGETLRRALGPPPPDFDSAARTLGIPVERLHEAMRAAGGGRRP